MRFPEFPFRAKFGSKIVTVLERHECGWYRVEGFGLVQPGNIERIVEGVQEMAIAEHYKPAIESQAQSWITPVAASRKSLLRRANVNRRPKLQGYGSTLCSPNQLRRLKYSDSPSSKAFHIWRSTEQRSGSKSPASK
jgi:hypothetical protein